MSKVRDRFETALRLSAQAEGVHLRDAKEEMRPRSKRDIEEIAFGQSRIRGHIGERCASERIEEAVERALGHFSNDLPSDLDLAIIGNMDDADVTWYGYRPDDIERLKLVRDRAWRP